MAVLLEPLLRSAGQRLGPCHVIGTELEVRTTASVGHPAVYVRDGNDLMTSVDSFLDDTLDEMTVEILVNLFWIYIQSSQSKAPHFCGSLIC